MPQEITLICNGYSADDPKKGLEIKQPLPKPGESIVGLDHNAYYDRMGYIYSVEAAAEIAKRIAKCVPNSNTSHVDGHLFGDADTNPITPKERYEGTPEDYFTEIFETIFISCLTTYAILTSVHQSILFQNEGRRINATIFNPSHIMKARQFVKRHGKEEATTRAQSDHELLTAIEHVSKIQQLENFGGESSTDEPDEHPVTSQRQETLRKPLVGSIGHNRLARLVALANERPSAPSTPERRTTTTIASAVLASSSDEGSDGTRTPTPPFQQQHRNDSRPSSPADTALLAQVHLGQHKVNAWQTIKTIYADTRYSVALDPMQGGVVVRSGIASAVNPFRLPTPIFTQGATAPAIGPGTATANDEDLSTLAAEALAARYPAINPVPWAEYLKSCLADEAESTQLTSSSSSKHSDSDHELLDYSGSDEEHPVNKAKRSTSPTVSSTVGTFFSDSDDDSETGSLLLGRRQASVRRRGQRLHTSSTASRHSSPSARERTRVLQRGIRPEDAAPPRQTWGEYFSSCLPSWRRNRSGSYLVHGSQNGEVVMGYQNPTFDPSYQDGLDDEERNIGVNLNPPRVPARQGTSGSYGTFNAPPAVPLAKFALIAHNIKPTEGGIDCDCFNEFSIAVPGRTVFYPEFTDTPPQQYEAIQSPGWPTHCVKVPPFRITAPYNKVSNPATHGAPIDGEYFIACSDKVYLPTVANQAVNRATVVNFLQDPSRYLKQQEALVVFCCCTMTRSARNWIIAMIIILAIVAIILIILGGLGLLTPGANPPPVPPPPGGLCAANQTAILGPFSELCQNVAGEILTKLNVTSPVQQAFAEWLPNGMNTAGSSAFANSACPNMPPMFNYTMNSCLPVQAPTASVPGFSELIVYAFEQLQKLGIVVQGIIDNIVYLQRIVYSVYQYMQFGNAEYGPAQIIGLMNRYRVNPNDPAIVAMLTNAVQAITEFMRNGTFPGVGQLPGMAADLLEVVVHP